jgi:imidazolonepropionase-like amidohydrolase
VNETLTSMQLCQAAGITYRQLDYWARAGLLNPTVETDGRGQGHGRQFTSADIGRARALGAVNAAAPALTRLIADQPAGPWTVTAGGVTITVALQP